MILTKNKSNFIKGIAVILMVFHHLFAFPDRVLDYSLISHLFGRKFEFNFALFGKICVPIFIFISGYGYYVIGTQKISYYILKILNLFVGYWLVFFLFIPVGMFFFSDAFGSASFDYYTIALNALALSSDYNKEWWFLEPYILIVLIVPVFNLVREKPFFIFFCIILFFITSYLIVFFEMDIKIISISLWLFWLSVFLMGYLFAFFSNKQFKIGPLIMLSMLFLFASAFYFFGFKLYLLVLFTPVVVFVFSIAYDLLLYRISFIFIKLGEKSLFIWLIHTFFCYYYFSYYVYYLNNSMLIFLFVLILSYSIGFILDIFNRKILSFLSKVFTTLSRNNEYMYNHKNPS